MSVLKRAMRACKVKDTAVIRQIIQDSLESDIEDKGNKNSGNWGHKGRPGQRGGSGSGGGGGGSSKPKRNWHSMSSTEYTAAKREDFPKQASPATRKVFEKALESEPQITASMTKYAQDVGADMEGLDFRIKDGDSFMRKVRADAKKDRISQETAANKLFDAVRYTQVSDEENMAANAKKTLESLKKDGYNIVAVKNTWKDTENPYNGVNVKVKSPSGQQFELQFHTPDSLKVKEQIHVLYEKQRVLQKHSKEWDDLNAQMMQISSGQKRPKDIDSL